MADIDAIFSREDMTFDEAVRYFKERVPITPAKFYALAEEYRSLAFTVSGYTKVQILKYFYEEILTALEEGNTLYEFQTNMNDFLESQGYEGLTPFQADNIFRTNIQTAYNVGHYEQMTSPSVMQLRPYWQYDAVNDARTRPSGWVPNALWMSGAQCKPPRTAMPNLSDSVCASSSEGIL